MKLDVTSRFTDETLFTAEIDCADDASTSIKIGLAVKWAVKTGANLYGANLSRANLYGANLDGASLSRASLSRANLYGANLSRASLDGASGVNEFIKCIQIDTYPVTYTAEVIQIGCQRHTHQEWAEFTDAEIRAMDGKKALEWWTKYKTWLFQTIQMCPAAPTK